MLSGDFVQGLIADADMFDRLLGCRFDAVMYYASFIQVGESEQQPPSATAYSSDRDECLGPCHCVVGF